jgi:hypothetical protein
MIGARLGCALLAAALGIAGCAQGEPQVEELALLAQPEPWPWVSRLVGYGGRLWFANSSLGVQHNSADLYSYDPRSGSARYERQLFSQAAGHPAVLGGRLYWPHDDSRFHLALGHVSVTDGERWQVRVIPDPPIHHLHALAVEEESRLLAVAAHRRPMLLVSEDGAHTWQVRVLERREAGGIARLLRVAVADGRVFGDFSFQLRRRMGRRLVVERDGALAAVPGWPVHGEILALLAFRERAWAVVDEGGRRGLWRSDGRGSERVGDGPPCSGLRDLATEGDGLFALCSEPGGGSVWRSVEGLHWTRHARLSGGWPHELVVYAGAPFVGGRSSAGRGALWGPAAPASVEAPDIRPLPPLASPMGAPPSRAASWAAARAKLARELASPAAYADGAVRLRDQILVLAAAGPPGDFFSSLLNGPFPDGRIPWQESDGVARADMARWLLLWGTSLAGSHGVPVELLARPWDARTSERGKYLDTTLGAIAAVQGGGQRDAATVEALIGRLGERGDPLWLTGDVVGALTSATGQRFGYDRDAWKGWWQESRAAWGAH